MRDLASLNKMELLPWDLWGIIDENEEDVSEKDRCFLDRAAALILDDDTPFADLRSVYEEDVRLLVPSVIRMYFEDDIHTITPG